LFEDGEKGYAADNNEGYQCFLSVGVLWHKHLCSRFFSFSTWRSKTLILTKSSVVLDLVRQDPDTDEEARVPRGKAVGGLVGVQCRRDAICKISIPNAEIG
jgi:hypothetical protein